MERREGGRNPFRMGFSSQKKMLNHGAAVPRAEFFSPYRSTLNWRGRLNEGDGTCNQSTLLAKLVFPRTPFPPNRNKIHFSMLFNSRMWEWISPRAFGESLTSSTLQFRRERSLGNSSKPRAGDGRGGHLRRAEVSHFLLRSKLFFFPC